MFSIAVISVIVIHGIAQHVDEEIFHDNCSSFAGWTKSDLSDAEMSGIDESEVTLSSFECTTQWCFQIRTGHVITSSSISVENYQNVTLQYAIKPFWLEANDFCNVYYTQNNNNWTLLTQYGSHMNNIWQTVITHSLPLTNNSKHIKLRFSVTANTNDTDSCFIDEIYVFATQISQPPQITDNGMMVIGIIVIASIGFLFVICFFKMLSDQIELFLISTVKSNQVASMSVGGANLSFLEEEEKVVIDPQHMHNFAVTRKFAAARKQEAEIGKFEAEDLRNFNFALTRRFSGTGSILDGNVASDSSLNLHEVNEKLKYHISGLTVQKQAT